MTALLAVALSVLVVRANLCIRSDARARRPAAASLSGRGAANSAGKPSHPGEIRLTRVLSAVLLGEVALSLSGFLLRDVNNPIALDPFMRRLLSAVRRRAAMIVLLGANRHVCAAAAVVAAAFHGGCAATIGTSGSSSRTAHLSSMAMLIVAGVMVEYICSAATRLYSPSPTDQSIVNLHNWSLGASRAGSSWDDVAVIAVVVITVSACVAIHRPLSAFQLGKLRSVGVNVARFRVVLVSFWRNMLSACVTAFAGRCRS